MKPIEIKNRNIAEFMGAKIEMRGNLIEAYTYKRGGHRVSSTPITWCETEKESMNHVLNGLYNEEYGRLGKYKKDLNDIMEVLDKIDSLGFQYNITNNGKYVYIGNGKDIAFISKGDNMKENVFDAVARFAEWHNESQKI